MHFVEAKGILTNTNGMNLYRGGTHCPHVKLSLIFKILLSFFLYWVIFKVDLADICVRTIDLDGFPSNELCKRSCT